MNHSGLPEPRTTPSPGVKAYWQMITGQLLQACQQLGKADLTVSKENMKWASQPSRPASSTSRRPNPLSSLKEKYHQSPSGLLIPDSLNSFLSAYPSLDTRFGDIMSNAWNVNPPSSKKTQCVNCGMEVASGHFHICSPTNAAPIMPYVPPSYKPLGLYYDAYQYSSASPGFGWDPQVVCSQQCPYCHESYDIRMGGHQCRLPYEKRAMPVIGFRAWNAVAKRRLGVGTAWRLKSTGIASEWDAGVNAARCSGKKHCVGAPDGVVPNERCGCGFYVLANLDEIEKHVTIADDHVVGAVLGWGKVVQHGDEGWRAQYAQVIALLDMKYGEANDRATQAISKAYGVPVYERKALEMVVKEYGQEVKSEDR